VVNWAAALPSPGGPYSAGTPPVITGHPQSQTLIAGDASATFTVTASGPALRYQWRKDGQTLLGKTNATLTISPVNLPDAGDYQAVVLNNSGIVISSNAHLTVLVGIRITQQPQSAKVRPGASVTFSVSATSSSPISYQWRKDGTNLPGANASFYNVPSVQYENWGVYDVVLTDPVGPVVSLPATLSVLIDPVIAQSPVSQSVPAGQFVTLSVQVSNTATLPIGYRWRLGSQTMSSNYLSRYVDFYTVRSGPNVSNYNCAIYNEARPNGVLSGTGTITPVVDSDNDGIPDEWENAYGLNPTNNADLALDSDGDTMSNFEEYIAGTNPTNEFSYLKVDTITPTSGATLSFIAVSNKTYTIEFTDVLGASWRQLISTAARTTNWSAVVSDPTGNRARYYRIATPSSPGG
jgi:hypothetical protein